MLFADRSAREAELKRHASTQAHAQRRATKERLAEREAPEKGTWQPTPPPPPREHCEPPSPLTTHEKPARRCQPPSLITLLLLVLPGPSLRQVLEDGGQRRRGKFVVDRCTNYIVETRHIGYAEYPDEEISMLWRVCSHGHHNGADAVHLLRPLAAFRSCGGLEVEIPSVEVEKGAYYYDLSHAAVAPAVRQRMVELPYLHKPGLGVDGPLLASEESSDARGEHVADRTVNATWRFAHELLYLERWAAEGTPRAACGCCSRPLAFGIHAHTDACAGCSEGGVNSTYDPAAITSGIERKAARGSV